MGKRNLNELYLDALARERRLRKTVQQTAQWLRQIAAQDPILGTVRFNDCVNAAHALDREARRAR